jgi:hypothetical protein
MTREVGLVSCTKSKTDHSAPPKDLYEPSALFRKARRYCKDTHDEWYILSAKHGLLEPDGPPIDPPMMRRLRTRPFRRAGRGQRTL